VNIYEERDKDLDGNNNYIQVLSRLENQLHTIESIDIEKKTTKWSESYCYAKSLMCAKLPLLIMSNYEEIIHGIKDDFTNPVNILNIEETLYSDISDGGWQEDTSNIQRAVNAAEACFILSSITKPTTKGVETLKNLINGPFRDDVHKFLFSHLPDVQVALFKAIRRKTEVQH
ncbi:hypothetical protein Tco_1519423, partial [Tanacetum coccineum]